MRSMNEKLDEKFGELKELDPQTFEEYNKRRSNCDFLESLIILVIRKAIEGQPRGEESHWRLVHLHSEETLFGVRATAKIEISDKIDPIQSIGGSEAEALLDAYIQALKANEQFRGLL